MDAHTRLTLLLARLLITDAESWTTGALARDRADRPVPALDPTATRWCPRGAVYLIVNGDIEAFERAVGALEASCRTLYGSPLRSVNDASSPFAHQAVLGAFDHAVDALALARAAHSLIGRPMPPDVDILGLRGRGRRRAPATARHGSERSGGAGPAPR